MLTQYDQQTSELVLGVLQWLAHAGRVCTEESSLAASGLREGSVVQMCVRVRGGGGDGGSTGAESRSSFLEMYARKKPAKVCQIALLGVLGTPAGQVLCAREKVFLLVRTT